VFGFVMVFEVRVGFIFGAFFFRCVLMFVERQGW
jgi:hypothetical protein